MKHCITFLFVLLLISGMLVGCSDKTVIPEKGDFSFSVPIGYSIKNVTDAQCDIIRDDIGLTVGGIAITELKLRDLKDKNTKNLLDYLQNSFHRTDQIEFIAMLFGNKHPAVSINMTAYDEDGTANGFIHYFFEKDFGVYHMWFDTQVAEQGIELDFVPAVVNAQ